jgi:hypothetical protein
MDRGLTQSSLRDELIPREPTVAVDIKTMTRKERRAFLRKKMIEINRARRDQVVRHELNCVSDTVLHRFRNDMVSGGFYGVANGVTEMLEARIEDSKSN